MAHTPDSVIAGLRRRDPHTLDQLVAEHARSIFRGARSMGFSPDEAEDLTQDVFLTFIETLDRFEGRSQVSTWLFGILYRKGLERRRVQVRLDQHSPIDDDFDARFDASGAWTRPPVPADRIVESSQVIDALRQCLAALPPAHRDAFHLRQVQELPAADAASILGLTVNHVGVLLHRARLMLRQCLVAKGHGRS